MNFVEFVMLAVAAQQMRESDARLKRLREQAERQGTIADHSRRKLQRLCAQRGHAELVREQMPYERATYHCSLCRAYL